MSLEQLELNDQIAGKAAKQMEDIMLTNNGITTEFIKFTVNYDEAPYYTTDIKINTTCPIKHEVYANLVGCMGDKLMDLRNAQNERGTKGLPKNWQQSDKLKRMWANKMKAIYQKDSEYTQQFIGRKDNPAIMFWDRQVLNVNSKKYERCIEKIGGVHCIQIYWDVILKEFPDFGKYIKNDLEGVTNEIRMVLVNAYDAMLVHMNSKNDKMRIVQEKIQKGASRKQQARHRR